MRTTRVTFGDVRWLDEHALVAAALAKDPEAFSELIRRYDPVVRYKIWRVLGGAQLVRHEQLDGVIADFWCGLVDADLRPLAEWNADGGELLAAALGGLATQFAGDRLRQLLRELALADTLADTQADTQAAPHAETRAAPHAEATACKTDAAA